MEEFIPTSFTNIILRETIKKSGNIAKNVIFNDPCPLPPVGPLPTTILIAAAATAAMAVGKVLSSSKGKVR